MSIIIIITEIHKSHSEVLLFLGANLQKLTQTLLPITGISLKPALTKGLLVPFDWNAKERNFDNLF
jgi:hypothetical protein